MKKAVITGASGGLGQAIAREFFGEYDLYLTGRDGYKLSRLAVELDAECGWYDLRHDLTGLIEDIRSWGKVDVLVNCAGVFPVKPLEDTTDCEIEGCFSVNVKAPFILSRELSKDMQGWGRIVNIGSSSAYNGFKNTSLYCASKHALLGLSRALHGELKGKGIRVYCISPGSIKTEMGREVPSQDYKTFIDPAEIAKYIRFIISFDNEMVSEEIRLNRVVAQ